MDAKQLEKYSSAITLSDMEIFVFPELMYSLVLANIMSPVIWKWRQRDCFVKLQGKDSYKKLMRLRQFVMDEYEFNLDLETWGLTSQDKELKRFEKNLSPEEVAQSNALFGYHGDKYYYDVDIRKHFGLDKYNNDVIPYWKTETIEAMDAFRMKDGYRSGAGECVSLSALYVAAAYIVCGIPLEDIFMILTPLHSQNFIDLRDGILTNNRRLVTKTMWFNGTVITQKAQRALQNENVTIVAHPSGYIHCLYNEATIDPRLYDRFKSELGEYLSEKLGLLTLANFLRHQPKYQKSFQFCCQGCRGGDKFVKAEVLFHYEHDSRFRIAEDTFEKLIAEIDTDDLLSAKMAERLCCQQLIAFMEYEELDIRKESDLPEIAKYIKPFVSDSEEFIKSLAYFLHTEAKLPADKKKFIDSGTLKFDLEWDRQQVIDYLSSMRPENDMAESAFYAYRDMESCRWEPFVKAAIERCPVSLEMAEGKDEKQIYQWLSSMPDISIYEGKRLAQPDEVANYRLGDGLEKAFVMANILRQRQPDADIELICEKQDIVIRAEKEYQFTSSKELSQRIKITGDGSILSQQ